MAKETKIFDLETALSQLDNIVEQLESGDQNLDKSLALFEEGIQLTRKCQRALNQAEQRVQQLLEQKKSSQPIDFKE